MNWHCNCHARTAKECLCGESSIDLVRRFHERFKQAINDEPHVDDDTLNTLRVNLLQEELNELDSALFHGDIIATLDALTDLQYVLDGAYLSLGFHRHKNAALAEVHRSNMSKLGADGRPVYRADGKVTKGPSYSPPDLAAVMQHVPDDFEDEEPTPTYVRAANEHVAPRVDFMDRFDVGGEG